MNPGHNNAPSVHSQAAHAVSSGPHAAWPPQMSAAVQNTAVINQPAQAAQSMAVINQPAQAVSSGPHAAWPPQMWAAPQISAEQPVQSLNVARSGRETEQPFAAMEN